MDSTTYLLKSDNQSIGNAPNLSLHALLIPHILVCVVAAIVFSFVAAIFERNVTNLLVRHFLGKGRYPKVNRGTSLARTRQINVDFTYVACWAVGGRRT